MSINQIRSILFQNLAPFLDDKDMMMESNNFIVNLNKQRNKAIELPICYPKKEVIVLATRRTEELMKGVVTSVDNREVFNQVRNIH